MIFIFLNSKKYNFFNYSLLVLHSLTAHSFQILPPFSQSKESKFHSAWLQEMRTYAQVFSQTLAHGNRKNEIRQRNRERRWMIREELKWKECVGRKKAQKPQL